MDRGRPALLPRLLPVRGPRPHHHRVADDRHLLVRSLPPHHLPHHHRRRGVCQDPHRCSRPMRTIWPRGRSSGRTKPINLMDIGTIGAKHPEKAGQARQAGRVRGDQRLHREDHRRYGRRQGEDWLLLFKNETHNHPTEIEPFGGAATCIGGAIRDPLSGRRYVYRRHARHRCGRPPHARVPRPCPASCPSARSSPPPPRATAPTATRSAWPPAMVDELYHPGYAAKRMEIGAVIAAAPADQRPPRASRSPATW